MAYSAEIYVLLNCQIWQFQEKINVIQIISIFSQFFCRKVLIKISYINGKVVIILFQTNAMEAEEASYSLSGRDIERTLTVTHEK